MLSRQQSSRKTVKTASEMRSILSAEGFFFVAKGKDVKRVPREVSKLVMIFKLNGNEK